MRHERQFAELGDGTRLAYFDIGGGPAILFLHGAGVGASSWSNFKGNCDAFVRRGYRVLMPDLPGFGYSSKPTDVPLSTEYYADCALEFLDRLSIPACSVVGNSMGGPVALKMALDRPDRIERLILMGPGGIEDMETYMQSEGNRTMFPMFLDDRPMDEDDLRRLLELQVFDPRHVTDALVAERAAVMRMQPRAILRNLRGLNLADRLGEIACPILGFWGMEDKFNPASGALKFLARCRDARFMIVNRCGHWVMVEHAELFNRVSLDFLDEGRSAAPIPRQ